MQWYNAIGIFIFLWCCTIPSVLYYAIYKHGGLVIQWSIIPFSYTILQIFLIYSYTTTDWLKQCQALVTISSKQQKDTSKIQSTSLPPPPRQNHINPSDDNFMNETTSLLSLTV